MSKNKKIDNKQDETEVINDNIKTQIPATMESIFGSISWLMLHSPAHRHMFISDYEWLVMPALQSKQFRVIRQGNTPIAYISWAYLDEETEERVKKGMIKLKPTEWTQGDRLWIIDVIAPFGGSKQLLQKLNETEFKGKKANVLRPTKDGKGLEGILLNDLLKEGGDKEDK
ncbi:MAG: toxin-activating lysine-acyltransferase [Rickettsiales bacterium]|nr:toxin-activating lysine-acyltransferase [Pseudomonadota bacterium]MDG4544230.1 toxin-activating lysine-acyltransferase [Rickettsiales bacterium]MDG4546409.1 toxin-activating lysine-acyltransferase [Rickettsiales bacterium]MDG4548554.1 toxin-activating lysine-acyltransferase [Rickettsiales bacterium]